MKVEEIGREGSRVVYRVQASPEEYAAAVRGGAHAFFMQPGSEAPSDEKVDYVLSQVAGPGESIDALKVDAAVNYLLPRAVEAAGVLPVCAPASDVPDAPAAGEGLSFTMKLFPKPVAELSSYEPVSIEVDTPHVTEAEIDQRMAEIADGAVRAGTLAHNMDGTPSQVDDEWVRKNVPDPDCNTVAELRERLVIAGQQHKSQQFTQYKMSLASSKMMERLDLQIPDDMLDAMVQGMIDDLRGQLESSGKTFEGFLKARNLTEDALRADARAQSDAMLRQAVTLDAVFRHEHLEATEEDRKAALSAIAPGNEQAAYEQMKETGYLFTIEESAQRLKAGAYILAQAHVKVNE